MAATKLDGFTRAYITAALWLSMDEAEEPLDMNYTIEDVDPVTMAIMVSNCRAFQEANADDIGERAEQAGHDFWLTRNGHGAGFWDGGWPEEAGRRLSDAAKRYGPVDLYVGDDGRIHTG